MYIPLPNNLTVAKSNIHGLGLFATAPISGGHMFGVSHIRADAFQDGWIRTPIGGFYNHSENPNCHTVSSLGDIEITLFDSRMFLVALRDIEEGEEITAKYRLYLPL